MEKHGSDKGKTSCETQGTDSEKYSEERINYLTPMKLQKVNK
jgi:hypothetical protein